MPYLIWCHYFGNRNSRLLWHWQWEWNDQTQMEVTFIISCSFLLQINFSTYILYGIVCWFRCLMYYYIILVIMHNSRLDSICVKGSSVNVRRGGCCIHLRGKNQLNIILQHYSLPSPIVDFVILLLLKHRYIQLIIQNTGSRVWFCMMCDEMKENPTKIFYKWDSHPKPSLILLPTNTEWRRELRFLSHFLSSHHTIQISPE